jgi:hypothetical protein
MPNISRSSIHQVLDRAAKTINSAAGADGRASRADIAKKLAELTGAEKALVDTFYKYVDHRDAVPGASITPADVASALKEAKAKLVDAYDLDKNGLSPDERAKMAQVGQLAAQIAELQLTPLKAAKVAAGVLATPKWLPDALPAMDPATLSVSAKRSFDSMAKKAAVNDLLTPPIARKLTAGGEQYAVVAQFMHDSFSIELYNANGRRVAHGSGWGPPDSPIEWR